MGWGVSSFDENVKVVPYPSHSVSYFQKSQNLKVGDMNTHTPYNIFELSKI